MTISLPGVPESRFMVQGSVMTPHALLMIPHPQHTNFSSVRGILMVGGGGGLRCQAPEALNPKSPNPRPVISLNPKLLL